MITEIRPDWRPRELLRVEAVWPTSMRVVLAVTDAGKAYIKPLGGSSHGPHCLACELIGTRLAGWFGLPTLDYAVMELSPLEAEMIRDAGGQADAGPAFATRAISEAYPWSGLPEELGHASNPRSIPMLVAFDTWTLNWDRHPPDGDGRSPNYDNVLLVKLGDEEAQVRILAIDHGECFSEAQELTAKLASIGRTKDDRIYGLFPGFRPFMRQEWIDGAAARLGKVNRQAIASWASEIPDEWQVPEDAKQALMELICGRAAYLADRISDMLRFSSGDFF